LSKPTSSILSPFSKGGKGDDVTGFFTEEFLSDTDSAMLAFGKPRKTCSKSLRSLESSCKISAWCAANSRVKELISSSLLVSMSLAQGVPDEREALAESMAREGASDQ